MVNRLKKVLFVCVGNSCRSQMAEGFARYFARRLNKDVHIESAGTSPAREVSPSAIQVMKEEGIDISSQRPKRINPQSLREFDIVISMGCDARSSCPALSDERVIDWGIPDPIGKPVSEYRRVRDMIKEKVRSLIESM